MPPVSSAMRPSWLALAIVLAACIPELVDPPTESGTGSTSATTDPPPTSGPGMTSTPSPTTTGVDTSGSTSPSSSDSGSVDETSFIPRPDGCFSGGPEQGWISHCSVIECDLGAQDCPRGEKCMPWANDGGNAWNASRCSPVSRDAVPPGGTCTVEGSAVTGIDDCIEGSMCWGVDPKTLQGTCIDLCYYENFPRQGCDEPTVCLPLNEGYVPLCGTPCNPLQPEPCPAGEACRNVAVDGGFYCLPLVGGQLLDSSEFCDEATCLPSQVCAGTDLLPACATDRCCTELCDLGDPGADAQCAAIDPMLVCAPLYEPGTAPAGLELVGLCALP
jgi:hypothetical protein